jgi:uncharacterized protein (TIGR02453 family)
MAEAYFSPASFRFLRELAKHNERDWFAANKPRYEEHVRQPFLRLIGDLQAPLAKISPHYRADPRGVGGSLFRIYRDTRFSNDKRPYKTSAGARLFHARSREREAPSFYVHIQPGQCFIGAGLWHPQPDTLKRVREFLVDNPSAWIKATRSSAFRQRFEIGGESLTRPPRGYDPAHPLIDDIKRKGFTAWTSFEDEQACAADLPKFIAASCKGMAPMVDYLCAALDLEF